MSADSLNPLVHKAVTSSEVGLMQERSLPPVDVYSFYEAGLDKLLERFSKDHFLYYDALGLEHRLLEHIRYTRRYGDNEVRKAERNEIIDQLNRLAASVTGLSFNDLCSPSAEQGPSSPTEEIEVSDQELLPAFQFKDLHINGKFDDNIAILHVYSHGTDQYRAMLINSKLEQVYTDPSERPMLLLNQIELDKQGTSTSSSVRQALSSLDLLSRSRTMRVVLKQLNELRKLFHEKTYLLIEDFTNFEIPWEMLQLPSTSDPSKLEAGYLGALITVSRWQCIVNDEYDELPLTIDHDECCGNIVTYLSDDVDTDGGELTILKSLEGVVYNDVLTLKRHLRQDTPGCAMVYLGCHGFVGEDLYSLALGSQANEQQRLFLSDLYSHRELTLLSKSRSIVFLNASHSGRLHVDTKYFYDEHLHGFAELFLAKGARGVIGTLGTVTVKHATLIRRILFEELFQSPDVPVATLLCNVRARIVKNLPEELNDSDLLSLICAFRYIYYGNPKTILRFTKPGGASNAS